ncbi:MAG: metabolite traffic protein EboE [Planctomycetota bacterium]
MAYCTNSHAGSTLDLVEGALAGVFADVRRRLELTGPMAVGLWLPATTVRELVGGRLAEFRAFLRDHGFFAPSLNAFPWGPFHQPVVKEDVYEPAWWTDERVHYTVDCARVLAELLEDRPADWPADVPGAISTVGGGNARLLTPARRETMSSNLGTIAREFAALRERTGHEIVLGLEPEPLTVLELTPDSVQFFTDLHSHAGAVEAAGGEDALRRHIGVCFDACHQAVLWEDVPASYRAFLSAGVRVSKVQISAAVEAPPTPDRLSALARYAEPRYLHQVYAERNGHNGHGGPPEGKRDLPDALEADGWRADDTWRCHFHVPIFLHELGYGLLTTRNSLERLLGEIRHQAALAGASAPLLEVETYTWAVLPHDLEPEYDPARPGGPAGISAEMNFVREFWGRP